jgi:hypothetical protein
VPGCARCEGPVEPSHRFCPWCAAPQRLKLTELFRPHPEIEGDEAKVLRVSRYLDSPVGRHVRFSIWDESATAVAAVSLDDDEAARLVGFLGAIRPASRRLRRLLAR